LKKIFELLECCEESMVTRAGPKDQAARILEEAVRSPHKCPTRILGSAGVGYQFLYRLLEFGLVEIQGKEHYGRRLRLTEKGRLFLNHYRILDALLPTQ
jgi:predicted transcriptional regulator